MTVMWTHVCLYHFLLQLLSAVSVFQQVCLHWLHNTFRHKNRAAVPLFASASRLSTSMWHTTVRPQVITIAMALQHWVKYHRTLSDPQLSPSKHWNVTGPEKVTWCTLWTESGQVLPVTHVGGKMLNGHLHSRSKRITVKISGSSKHQQSIITKNVAWLILIFLMFSTYIFCWIHVYFVFA